MKASSPAQLSRLSQAPLAEMPKWFRDALGDWGPLPSTTECDKLARRFRLLVNWADNSEKFRIAHQRGLCLLPVDSDLKDASVDDFLGVRLENVRQAGKEFLFRLDELEKFAGNYHWKGPSETISIDDLQHILFQIGVLVGAEAKAKPPRGQPPKVWHQVAREFARDIETAIRTLNRKDVKKESNPIAADSATAVICSEALSWAYGKKITPEAFVTAMRSRDRRKITYKQRFPDVPSLLARIRTLSGD